MAYVCHADTDGQIRLESAIVSASKPTYVLNFRSFCHFAPHLESSVTHEHPLWMLAWLLFDCSDLCCLDVKVCRCATVPAAGFL